MSKYRAVPTVIDGIRFASKREANRYCELKLLLRDGAITDLELQPKFPVIKNGQHITTYVADFKYKSYGSTVIEDVKGVRTPVYKLKKKLIEAVYGVTIVEVS
jgi:Protein of unknown function (DUF1064)